MIRNLIIAGKRGSFYDRNLNPDKISQQEYRQFEIKENDLIISNGNLQITFYCI
jgi:hypothetical protein